MSPAKPPPNLTEERDSYVTTNIRVARNAGRHDSRPDASTIILSAPLGYPTPRPRGRYLLLFILTSFAIWAIVISPHIHILLWKTPTILLKDSPFTSRASRSSTSALDIKKWLASSTSEQPRHSVLHDLVGSQSGQVTVAEYTKPTTNNHKSHASNGIKKPIASALLLKDLIRPKKRPRPAFIELPSFKPRPDLTYENVQPLLHKLTDEQAFDEESRFMTYLPHSGFHNQRIELHNAFQLARLLNRTLVLPQIRLGRASAWAPSRKLAKTTEHEMKKRHLDCVGQNLLSNQPPSTPEDCETYSQWTAVHVNYLLDMEKIMKEQPVVDQLDVRESWLWEALHLNEGDWYNVEDKTRYSYQLFESKSGGGSFNEKYEYRLNIDDLKRYGHVKLLSFGSLFGSDRVIIESRDSKLWKAKLRASQLPKPPILLSISDQIAEQLGGRGSYVGLHLRVGDLYFRNRAPQSMPKVFSRLCHEVFHLGKTTVDQLIQKHEERLAVKSHIKNRVRSFITAPNDSLDTEQPTVKTISYSSWNEYEDQEDYTENHLPANPLGEEEKIDLDVPFSLGQGFSQHRKRGTSYSSRSTGSVENLKCRGPLYTDPKLERLNMPIYIATDVAHPMDHIHLSIFFETFPCVFILSDFTSGDVSRNLRNLDHLRSANDGLKLKPFFEPLLEALVVSKGSSILGTPGSTFSNYAVSILHAHYSKESASTPRRGS
ncbi:hypothetical protein CROQUDRAFT_135704 [Cronartium quercuum f. sp. fusiforme G11]|uniref:O-fucosyltransferase family protein n=1 Tax=Cronartium quercuum f. sp. fusiforme G11 TaxID=708437 RepID=A0A9P6NEI3_9BASI|nr:hypothetical protein CROQUDRAFT_135704 [Cronartium quercuum f. sp. fusiforme G11]